MWPINRQQTDEWFNFLNEFRAYEREILLREKEDALLDIYSLWQKTKDASLKSKFMHLAKEIKCLDPSLNFDELLKKKELS